MVEIRTVSRYRNRFIENGDFSDIPKTETYAAFYLKGWSGIEDEHAGVDI